MDISEIKDRLNHQAEEICRTLLPNGKKESKRWIVGSVDGEKGRSLSVPLEGPHRGNWRDFSSDAGGDMIDLWKSVKNQSLQDALVDIKNYLGIKDPNFLQAPVRSYKKPERPVNKSSNIVVDYLTKERGLTVETLKKFKVESDGEFYFLPSYRGEDLVSWKKISVKRDEKGKKKMFCSAESEPILFGWQALDPDARHVYITEGEIDAMTLTQMGFPALSVPFGAGAGDKMRWIESEYKNLDRFESIHLCFDNDEAGQAAVRDYSSRLGIGRTHNIKLPLKDANECFKANHEILQAALYDGGDPISLDSVVHTSQFLEETIRRFYPDEQAAGFPLPFGDGTHMKFRPSEITLWTGTNGHGKSLVLGQLLLDLIESGQKVFLASMEFTPGLVLKRMVRQATTISQPSKEYIAQTFNWWMDNFLYFNVVGSTSQTKLLEAMAYARQRYGATHFVIDSLMKCGIDSTDYGKQKAFVSELCDFKSKYDCHVHLVAHVRKGENEHQVPDKLDVSGTSDITNLVDNQIAVWRNKGKEEEMRKPNPDEKKANGFDGLLLIQKQRNGEWEGKIPVWFDQESTQYLQRKNKPPKRYVEFSPSNQAFSSNNGDLRR